MKWYFASRMRHKKLIQKITDFVKSKGDSISFDWTLQPSLKPYAEHFNTCSSVSKKISDSLNNLDVFVMLADKMGTDMFIELGIAIGKLEDKNARIYVLGKFNNRSLMHFHPSLIRIDSFSDLFTKEYTDLTERELFIVNSVDEELRRN